MIITLRVQKHPLGESYGARIRALTTFVKVYIEVI